MKTIKAILSFCLSFISIGIIFELLLTFGGIMTPIININKEKGERYIPNKICNSIFINEGFGLARTNSYGWFGREFTDKGLSDISIAVIGNSFVASRQVFYRDNFLSIAEIELNKFTQNKHTSLFNFGKESLTLRGALYIKEEVDSLFNPDYYLIVINDSIFGGQGHYIPYYELKHDTLQLNTSFRQSPFIKKYESFKFLTKSSVLFLTYRVKNRLPQWKEILLDKLYSSKGNLNVENKLSYQLIDTVDRFILKELSKEKRVFFLLDLSAQRMEIVKALLDSLRVINLHDPLVKLKDQGINPYYWPITNQVGHWNRYAHKVVGTEIAKTFANISYSPRNFNTCTCLCCCKLL